MNRESPSAVDLVRLVQGRDLILVTGKGGVGKSTVVGLLAELASRSCGGAIAVESTAHGRLPPMISSSKKIEVFNIDVERAVPAVLQRLLKLPTIIGRLLNNRIMRLYIRTSPAIGELVLLEAIAALVAEHAPKGRPVIVDLPASGHALSLLDTPRSVARMLRVGPIAKLAGQLEALLKDGRRCQLVVVALPEELPVNETIELVRLAEAIGLSNRTVVVNQVPGSVVDDDDRSLLDLLSGGEDADLEQVAGAAISELETAAQARAQIDRLRREVAETVIELPLRTVADPRQRVASMVELLLRDPATGPEDAPSANGSRPRSPSASPGQLPRGALDGTKVKELGTRDGVAVDITAP